MIKIKKDRKLYRAQSLLELLLSVAVGTIMIGGSVLLMGVSLKNYQSIRQNLQANSLLRQYAEVIISLAKDNWHNIADLLPGVHYKIVPRGNIYTLQKGEEKVFDDSGLVGYWNLDEATSTTAFDSSGNTNNGTLTNGPTWQSPSNCVSSSCLSFDGSDDYVNCGNNASLNVGQPAGSNGLTLEAWIKPNSTVISDAGIIDNNNLKYAFTYHNASKLYFYIHDGSNFVVADMSYGAWHYVVGTWDGTAGPNSMKLFIDGQLVAQKASSYDTTSANGPIYIGKRVGKNSFDGLIDEVRIYNRALSAEEIKQHYQAGLDKLGLVSYWAMDEGGGTTAYDSQEVNNGTLTNGPTWQSPSNCVSGSCLSFDGSDDYVEIPYNSSLYLDGTNESVILWVKHNSNYILFQKNGWSRRLFNTYWVLIDIDGTYHYLNVTGSNDNKWHQVAYTYSNGEITSYVDGKLIETESSADLKPASDFWWLGRLCSGSSCDNYFHGLIDEVRIYNRALSAEEISSHYNAGYTRYVVLNKVSRSAGNIETSYNSANDDPSTLKVSSFVKYGRGLVSNQNGGVQQLNTYLTRSGNNRVFQQTDWSGGSGQTGPVPNPGNKFDSSDNIIFLNFNDWTLGGGAYVEDGVLYLPNYGAYALSPYIDINYADKWYFSADYYTEEKSDPEGSCSYDACRLLSAHYYDADYNSTTNSIGYTSNGSARQILLNQWYRNEWADGSGGAGGSNVKYVRIGISSDTTWTPSSYKVKNPMMTINGDWTYEDIQGKIFLANPDSSGYLISSILDTGVSGGAGFNSLLWQGSLGSGGSVKFQIAFSNSPSGPWTYYGPTSTSDYYQPNPNVSVSFPTTGSASPQNYRYIRYKVYLSTTGTTPQVDDIIINWSP